jgi:hypothetical protein
MKENWGFNYGNNVGYVSFKVTCDEHSYLQAIEPHFPC